MVIGVKVMKTTFIPHGVCSKQYDIELEDGVIKSIAVTGGCNGNLKGISSLITGKKAEEIIPLIKGTQCGNRPTSCPDQISIALEEALAAEKAAKEASKKKYSSSAEFDMNKEFVFANYKYLSSENSPVYGVENAKDVRISSIVMDELMYLLQTDGAHLILFGGMWSEATQAVIDRINSLAAKYNVDTVYNFDFYADGTNVDSNIKSDLTEQPSYDGPGKKAPVPCADCNYIYGEIVRRHLTNLNDWVTAKVGTDGSITYLNVYVDPVEVPNLHEPFLMLFNKDNTVDNSGAGNGSENGKYPIVAAMEIGDVTRDADGKLYIGGKEVSDLDEQIEKNVFSYIGKDGNDVTPYTKQDYMYDAFNFNTRGHSLKTEPCFQKGDKINIEHVSLRQLLWMFNQKGTFLFVMGGPWCACTQSAMTTLNDYALANNAKFYMFDSRLDSKYPVDYWEYPRHNELKLSAPYLKHYYIEIWEKYLPDAPVICSISHHGPFADVLPIVNYVDKEGKEHNVLSVGVPYIFAYNNDNEERGHRAPIIASRHDAGELINCSKNYIYHDPNYRNFKGGVYSVLYAYCESEGLQMHDITIDRTAPIVEGTPVRNPFIEGKIKYRKEHNWWIERADKAAAEAKANERAAQEEEDSFGCC
jgi:uncharacterized protein (TIGR03905 family)